MKRSIKIDPLVWRRALGRSRGRLRLDWLGQHMGTRAPPRRLRKLDVAHVREL
jgi:hypothetical protein